MRPLVLSLLILSITLIGCTTKYVFKPEDKALLENALKAADQVRTSVEAAGSAADRAEKAADRAEKAADRAEKAAEKAVRAFEMKQVK